MIISGRNPFYLCIILFLISNGVSCDKASTEPEKKSSDEIAIKQIHEDYISGWLTMDEEKILGLFEERSRIQPSSLTPIEGKDNIQEFWFPSDSSITTINQFDTEILSIEILDTLATLNYSSVLDWSYKKGQTEFGMTQGAINTFVCRRQNDDSWKVWRAMWTDVWSRSNLNMVSE